MSIQEIVFTAKAQLDEIEARSPRFWTDLGVDQVSVVLRIVGESFRSINQLARESDGADESKLLTNEQIQNILGLLGWLEDTFFPMAHTQERLGRLKIINGEEGNQLYAIQQHGMDNLIQRMEGFSVYVNLIQTEFREVKSAHEQMRSVLNP